MTLRKKVKTFKTDGRHRNDKPTSTPLNRGIVMKTGKHNISRNKITINKTPRRGTRNRKQTRVHVALVSMANLPKMFTSTNTL